jgi:hypothetical protein
VLVVSVLCSMLPFAASRAAADPNSNTDDRSVFVKTKSFFYTGVDLSTVTADLAANKARLTDVDVDPSATPETFTVTMVANSGAYKVNGETWFVDRTAAQLTSDLSSGGRLIDIDAYETSAGERYAEIIVPNVGATKRQWWYAIDSDPTSIQTLIDAHGARLTEYKSYMIGATQYYAAIMVATSGIDAKNWYYFNDASLSTIESTMAAWHYRPLSLEHDPAGGWDAVIVESSGVNYWAYVDQTPAQIAALLTANKARAVTVDQYAGVSGPLYAVVMVDNTDAQTHAINAETTRVAKILATGLGKGNYGVYLKQVGGPVLLGLNQGFRFEPASAIKYLYAVYAMTQVQSGHDSLSSDFVYYPDPSDPSAVGVCPDPAWETAGNAQHTTLQQAIIAMLNVSDNRMTRGMALRYGIANVDNFGRSVVGMTNTHLAQDRIGCLFVNGVRNQMTLTDAGTLYEKVDNGSLLNNANKTALDNMTIGGPVPSVSPLGDIVRAEAALQGKSSIAEAFIAAMSYREKAGNEFECLSATDCIDYTSIAGRITLPFKVAGNIVPTDYVYGRFGNDFALACVPGSGCRGDLNQANAINTLGNGGAETYRQQIAAALTTW